MDSSSSNEDDDAKVYAVLSSSSSSVNPNSKGIFDSIAFTVPRKEQLPATTPSLFTPPPPDPYIPTPTVGMSKTNSMVSMLADDLQSGDPSSIISTNSTGAGSASYEYSEFPLSSATGDPGTTAQTTLGSSHVAICVFEDGDDNDPPTQPPRVSEFTPLPSATATVVGSAEIIGRLESLELLPSHHLSTADVEGLPLRSVSQPEELSSAYDVLQQTAPVGGDAVPPSSQRINSLIFEGYDYEPPVEFPTIGMVLGSKSSTDSLHWKEFTPDDASYHAWIPSEETRKVLSTISSDIKAGTHVPDKEHMTMPGITLEDDLVR